MFFTEFLSRKFLKEARERVGLSVIAIACRNSVTEKECDRPQTAQTNYCVNNAADYGRLTAENRADQVHIEQADAAPVERTDNN